MIQPIFSKCTAAISATSIVADFWGTDSSTSTSGFGQTIVSQACTISNARIGLDLPPGAATSYIFTLEVNDSLTALVITISGAVSTSGVDITNIISLAANDKFRWRITVVGSPGNVSIRSVYADFNTVADRTSIYPMTTSLLNSVSPRWFAPLGIQLESSGAAANRTMTVPIAGTITGCAGYFEGSGTTGTGWEVALYKNGTKQDGAGGTVNTVMALSTTSSPVTNTISFSLSVAAGDLIYAELTRVGSASDRQASFCYTFVGAVSNKIPYFNLIPPIGATNSARYYGVLDADNALISTGEILTAILRPVELSDLYIVLAVAPSAGKTRVLQFRKSGVDTNLSVTIADAAVTGNNTANKIKYAASDTIGFQMTGTGTPTDSQGRASFVLAITSVKGAGGGSGNNGKKGGGGGLNVINAGGATFVQIGNPGLDVGVTL